jgi:hypothetical protein
MHTLESGKLRKFMDTEWEQNTKRNFDGTDGPWPIEIPQNHDKGKIKAVFKKQQPAVLQLNQFGKSSDFG